MIPPNLANLVGDWGGGMELRLAGTLAGLRLLAATRRKLEARPDLFKAPYEDLDTTICTYANGPASCVQ
jgi:hypothetical protein